MQTMLRELLLRIFRPIASGQIAALTLLCHFAAAEAQSIEAVPAAALGRNQPRRLIPNVIFDTDIWSDIDDALALGMLHALHDRHEVNLVAVTISTDDPWCAPYVDLVNTFYAHPQIPIAVVHGGITLDAFRAKFPPASAWPVTRYTQIISQRTGPDGSLVYPHRLTDGATARDAVSVLRKTLAEQPDQSVIVVEVGYHTNLARLLDSNADAASPLDGRALVAKKVQLLSVMAGNFAETQVDGKSYPKGAPEFNVLVDVQAAQEVFSRWPTPIVDSGFEVGLSMLYPGRNVTRDFAYAAHHPIADTYVTYCEEMKERDSRIAQCPEGHDHATFDLTAVLYAARPDRDYFSLSKPGRITVLLDGGTRFVEEPRGSHRYLILSKEQSARTLEAMEMLASQPPRSVH